MNSNPYPHPQQQRKSSKGPTRYAKGKGFSFNADQIKATVNRIEKMNWYVLGGGFIVFGVLMSFIFPRPGEFFAWLGVIGIVAQFIRNCHKRWPNAASVVSWLVGLFIILLCCVLFAQSAHIYAELGRAVGKNAGFINWHNLGASYIRSLPAVGWLGAGMLIMFSKMLHALEVSIWGIIFVLMFVYIQAGEIAPIVVKGSPKAMKSIIRSLSKHKRITPDGDESDTVLRLYDEHNNYYENLLTVLNWHAFACYFVDFIVCFTQAPIIKGGWSNYNGLLFDISQIDGLNVFRIFVTLAFFTFASWAFVQVRKFYVLMSGKID